MQVACSEVFLFGISCRGEDLDRTEKRSIWSALCELLRRSGCIYEWEDALESDITKTNMDMFRDIRRLHHQLGLEVIK